MTSLAHPWRPPRPVTFDAAVRPDGQVSVGVWDRFATFGYKEKDGSPAEFSPDNLRAFMRNWYARGERLPMCLDHASAHQGLVPAPAAAFYDAFALVEDGQVTEFKALARSVAEPPNVEALRQRCARFATAENQAPAPDGLWAFRCDVTPLGQHPTMGLRNYSGISPFFTMDGADEQGRPAGPVLFDVAAVNAHFMAGCELAMGHVPRRLDTPPATQPTAGAARAKGGNVNPELMKKMGLAEGASMEEKMAAYMRYAYEATPDEIKMMADDMDMGDDKAKAMAAKMRMMAQMAMPEATGQEMDAVARNHPSWEAQNAAIHLKTGNVNDEGGRKHSRMGSAHTESDGDEVAPEMMAYARALGINTAGLSSVQVFDAIRAATVPATKIPELVKATVQNELTQERERAAAEQRKERAGILMSRLSKDYPGDRAALERLAGRDPDEAEKLAAPWLPKTSAPAHLFGRMTQAGGPIGGPQEARTFAGPKQPKVVKTALGSFAAEDEELADEIKRYAESKDPIVMSRVDAKLDPALRPFMHKRLSAAREIVLQDRPELASQL